MSATLRSLLSAFLVLCMFGTGAYARASSELEGDARIIERSDGAFEFWSAEFLPGGGLAPPAADLPWRSVELPDRWRDPARFERYDQGWYRIRVEGPIPDEPWAIQPWRVSMNAEIWLNGERLGVRGSMERPVTRNWNRPLLFDVPASLWLEGENVIHARLAVHPHFGTMAPIIVGPRAALQSDHDRRQFTQIDLNRILFVLTVAIALLAFAFWLRRRSEQVYLYLAGACLVWSTLAAHLFASSVPVSAALWWKLVHLSSDLWIVLLTGVAHRLANILRPRVELALWTWVIGAGACYAMMDLAALIPVSNRIHALSVLTVLYLAVTLGFEAWRQRRSDLATFFAAILVMLGFGVHDLRLNTSADVNEWRFAIFLTPYGAPLVFVVLAWHVTGRFASALATAERAQQALEGRVADARAQLEAVFEERNTLAAREAVASERERIFRDLHDDVGARLLSIIYGAADGRSRDLARDALVELREMMSTMPTSEDALAVALPAWRTEVEDRLADANLACEWVQSEAAAGARATAHAVYHLTRMVREAVTNAIRHAQATGVRVEIDLDGAGALCVCVQDDGLGERSSFTPGRGVTSLRQRAREIGAILELVADASGTRMCVMLAVSDETVARADPPTVAVG